MVRRLILLVAVLAACAAEPPPTLPDFESTMISIDDQEMAVALADTAEKRARGLAGVTELGDLDGMLFAWDADTESGFWMKDTLIPLDIAFFAADGDFVDRLTMEPCTTVDCATYRASGPYRFAVEAPAGNLEFVGGDSVLVIDS